SACVRAKNKTKSRSRWTLVTNDTSSGSPSSSFRKPRGSPTSAARKPFFMPSFFTKGVPEYPAGIFLARNPVEIDSKMFQERSSPFGTTCQFMLPLFTALGDDHAFVSYCYSSFGCCERARPTLREDRIGRGLMIHAHFREIRICVRLESKPVLWLPDVILSPKQNQIPVCFCQLKGVVALHLYP